MGLIEGGDPVHRPWFIIVLIFFYPTPSLWRIGANCRHSPAFDIASVFQVQCVEWGVQNLLCQVVRIIILTLATVCNM